MGGLSKWVAIVVAALCLLPAANAQPKLLPFEERLLNAYYHPKRQALVFCVEMLQLIAKTVE